MKLNDVVVVSILLVFVELRAIPLRPRDLTLVPGSTGEDVVDAVIGKIRSILEERSDYDLLRRIAAVESNFGMKSSEPNYNRNGGIWQINLGIHNTLVMYEGFASIKPLVGKIRHRFELNCFVCNDMNYSVPMNSGLAAFVYIKVKFTAISLPETIAKQGQWWAQHYHDEGGIVETFIEKTEQFNNNSACGHKVNMDLWLLVDVSDDVSEMDFQSVKKFSRNLKEQFPSNTVRFGWSKFSFNHETVFKFTDPQDQFIETITAATKQMGRAGTGHALYRVLEEMKSESQKTEQLVYTVLLVITGGNSSDEVEGAAAALRNSNISTYVIGLENPKVSEIETIASEPSYRYSYILSQYSELPAIATEIAKALCTAPIPVQMANNVLLTLAANSNVSLGLKASIGKTIFVAFSSEVVSFRATAYISAALPNPNSACYDHSMILYKGVSEAALKADDFVEVYPFLKNGSNGSIPVYVTVNNPMKTTVSDLRVNAKAMNLTMDETTPTSSDNCVLIVLVTFIGLIGLVASTVLATAVYRSSKHYQKSEYTTKSRGYAEEALKIMELLHTTTDVVKESSVTLKSMMLLQDQLQFAEEQDIPEDKLAESQEAVKYLKDKIDTIRGDLREATAEAKKSPASYLAMTKLETLIEQARTAEFSEIELAEPVKVVRTLGKTMNPVMERLEECTEKARSASATTADEDKLQQILDQAIQLRLPTVLLFDARDTVERQRSRIASVKKRLVELTEESLSGNPRESCINEFDEEIVLAQLMQIPNHLIKPARKALSNMRKSSDVIKLDLLRETVNADDQHPSVRSFDKLKQSINRAEESKISAELLKEPKMVLTKLDQQISNVKKLTKETVESIDIISAGYPEMIKLEKILKSAEEMEIPMDELKLAYQVLETLKNRINPQEKATQALCIERIQTRLEVDSIFQVIDNLKKISFDAKKSTANLHTLDELEGQLSSANELHAPKEQIEEARKVLTILQKIKFSISTAKNNLQVAVSSNDLNMIIPVLNNVRNNQVQILAWNPDDQEFKDLLEKATDVEKSLVKALKAKNKRVSFNVEDLVEKLQTAMHKANSDWYEFRILKEEYETFCRDKKVTSKNKKLLDTVKKAYLKKTIDHILYTLETALASNNFETLEKAMVAAESILETDIPSAKNDSGVKSVLKRAEEALTRGPKSHRNVLKENIRSKLDGKMEELHKAIKLFEDEFGDSLETDEKELLAEARRCVAVKFKSDITNQLRTRVKNQDGNELEKILARYDKPLSQQALAKYELVDEELKGLVEAARKLQSDESEMEKIEEKIQALREEDFAELTYMDQPPPKLHDAMKATLLLLGHSEQELNEWSNMKVSLNYCRENITARHLHDINQEQAERARKLVNHIESEGTEESNIAADVLLSWTKTMLKRLQDQATSDPA